MNIRSNRFPIAVAFWLAFAISQLFSRTIEVYGSAKSIVANSNSIENVSSELSSVRIEPLIVNGEFPVFNKVSINLRESAETDRPNDKSVILFFQCRADTAAEMIPLKECILLDYIKLRMNGFSSVGATLMVNNMYVGGKGKISKPTTMFPTKIFDSIPNPPGFLTKHYFNKNDQIQKEKYFALRDDQIVWLFCGDEQNCEFVCGFDGKHVNLKGFQDHFDNEVEALDEKRLTREASQKITEAIWAKWKLRWWSPLEIPHILE